MTILIILVALSVICQILFLVFFVRAWREIRSALPARAPGYESELAKSAYLEARSKFMARENVQAVGLKKDDEGYFIRLTLRHPDPTMAKHHTYKLSDGSRRSIRIKTTSLDGGRIKAHSPDLSAQVFDVDDSSEWGTMGCLVKRNDDPSGQLHLLTCCHNVIHPVSAASNFISGSVTAGTDDSQISSLGKVFKIVFDNEVDAAIIALDSTALRQITNNVPGMGRPGALRSLENNDADNNLDVSICGAKSGYREGNVTGVYDAAKISYGSEESHQFINLITATKNGERICQDGDSGSVVLDNDCNVIGLVLASQPDETFIIPMDTILTKLNIQLV